MGKNIVILNGSPQKSGVTAALVKAFTDGAESAGASVTEFDLESMKLHFCLGCFEGNSSLAQPCVQHDDMDKIYPAIKACDTVVFASPLYYWNISGQLKTAIDRLVALEEGENLLREHGRSSALLMSASGALDQFDPVLAWYVHALTRLKWKDAGRVLATGNDDAQDMQRNEILSQANSVGEKVAHGFI